IGHPAVLRPYGGGTAAVMVVLAGSLWWRRRAAVAVAWLAVAVSSALLLGEMAAPGMVLRPGAAPALALLLAPTAPFAGYAVAVYGGGRRSAWLPVVVLVVLASAPWQESLIRIRQGLI